MVESESSLGTVPDGVSRIPLGARSGRVSPIYGRFVMTMKVLLPTVAIMLVALLFLWPTLSDEVSDIGMQFFGVDRLASDTMQLSNARYQGVDAENQPYTVTADGVRQQDDQTAEVFLTRPKADIMLEDSSWAALTAQDGVFDREAQILSLSGGVNFFHDLGYEFQTNSAMVDLVAGTAEGREPIDGQGPFGFVEAEGFKVFDRGARIVLTGKSKLVIYPDGR